jgi:hypothetical protein
MGAARGGVLPPLKVKWAVKVFQCEVPGLPLCEQSPKLLQGMDSNIVPRIILYGTAYHGYAAYLLYLVYIYCERCSAVRVRPGSLSGLYSPRIYDI